MASVILLVVLLGVFVSNMNGLKVVDNPVSKDSKNMMNRIMNISHPVDKMTICARFKLYQFRNHFDFQPFLLWGSNGGILDGLTKFTGKIHCLYTLYLFSILNVT